jgi:hypothetical protein
MPRDEDVAAGYGSDYNQHGPQNDSQWDPAYPSAVNQQFGHSIPLNTDFVQNTETHGGNLLDMGFTVKDIQGVVAKHNEPGDFHINSLKNRVICFLANL